MKTFNKIFLLVTLASSLTLAPINSSHAVEASEVGYMAGSGFGSLIYTPIKFASALVIGIVGGLSLMGTVPADAQHHSVNIVKAGWSGDWWITPDHLRGEQSFEFMDL